MSPAVLNADLQDAFDYAKGLAIVLHKQHYPEIVHWRVDDDLLGVLTQIDNMTAGLVRSDVETEI